MESINFITPAQVLRLHQLSLQEYGGMAGVRDAGLLESAVSQPAATFGGGFLHSFPFEMAAAYLYHLVLNHPFVDGNKRIAALAAIAFLISNRLVITADQAEYEALVMRAAQGQAGKQEIAAFFKAHCETRST